MSDFDRSDARYLARTLSVAQLRDEIRHAEVHGAVDEMYRGTEYETEDLFPWADYAAVCGDAIKIIQSRKPKPRPAEGGLDAEAVKAHNDIVAVIERYTRLQKSGKNFTGLCPIHQERHPSLMVYPDEQRFYCYGCQRHGDVIAFIMAMENVDFKQALAVLGA